MAALASAPITFLKVFATGIGAGILLDATVLRSLLVPALVSLFGRWNWRMPTGGEAAADQAAQADPRIRGENQGDGALAEPPAERPRTATRLKIVRRVDGEGC